MRLLKDLTCWAFFIVAIAVVILCVPLLGVLGLLFDEDAPE